MKETFLNLVRSGDITALKAFMTQQADSTRIQIYTSKLDKRNLIERYSSTTVVTSKQEAQDKVNALQTNIPTWDNVAFKMWCFSTKLGPLISEALIIAVQTKNAAITNMLLEGGFENSVIKILKNTPNIHDETFKAEFLSPHYALKFHPADPNIQTNENLIPLEVAVENNDPECVKSLLLHGAMPTCEGVILYCSALIPDLLKSATLAQKETLSNIWGKMYPDTFNPAPTPWWPVRVFYATKWAITTSGSLVLSPLNYFFSQATQNQTLTLSSEETPPPVVKVSCKLADEKERGSEALKIAITEDPKEDSIKNRQKVS